MSPLLKYFYNKKWTNINININLYTIIKMSMGKDRDGGRGRGGHGPSLSLSSLPSYATNIYKSDSLFEFHSFAVCGCVREMVSRCVS